jgi:hypothetical protein
LKAAGLKSKGKPMGGGTIQDPIPHRK